MCYTPRRSPCASSADVLCHAFQYLSKSTWSLLRRGRKQGVQINEETITNILMLRLQETASPHLRIKSFSKKQESRTGADWEWWLGTSGNWVGFRLQAKAINFTSDSFDHRGSSILLGSVEETPAGAGRRWFDSLVAAWRPKYTFSNSAEY